MPHTKSLGRRWHTNLLIVVVGIWAAWTFAGVVWALANSPSGAFGPMDSYLFLSLPMLLTTAAYLLFVQSSLAVFPFALLPVAYLWSAARLHPEFLSPARWTTLAGYLQQFPAIYLSSAGVCAVCAVYCLFLNKHVPRADEC